MAVQKIVVASGVEIRDALQGMGLSDLLADKAKAGASNTWTFPKSAAAGRETHLVSLVFTMAEFRSALDEAGAWVIYEGHSRFGQGPAFGAANTPHCPPTATYPVNPWGNHFRMGYDATDTECMGDIFEHAVKPTEYDLLAVPNTAFLPKALERAAKNATAVEDRRKKSRLSRRERRRPCSITGAWRKLNDCDSAIAAKKTCRGDKVLDGRHFYQRKPRRGDDEFLTAVKVGRADLDASSLKCSILFMASCSSHVHFYEALKSRRTAASSTCKFFLTAEVCSSAHARTFIKSVFAGNDPMTTRGAKKILKALNGEFDSGIVGVY